MYIFTAESQSTQRIIVLLLSAERAESNKEFIPTGKNNFTLKQIVVTI